MVLVDLADGHAGKPQENSFQLALEPLAALHATTAQQERLRRKLETGELGRQGKQEDTLGPKS